MSRVGVFVCHCGENIARTVDCAAVAETLKDHPGVAYTTDYKYMCSEPGQALVRKAIEENNLSGVVIAACSPHMHEKTFRNASDKAGLNKYMCEMANIREHCSWIHEDRGEATAKAIDISRTIVEKVKHNKPLDPIRIPITKRAVVIGAGIAGIQAALDIADGGHEVVLIEKEASIGGHMSQLSETFPTLDCSQCILTPRMVEAYQHPNIKLHTWSEVESVDGYIGNFTVKIRKKARSVNEDLCNGCGDCFPACPAKRIPSEFEAGLGNRTAIYVPFPQAVPNIPVLDRDQLHALQGPPQGPCQGRLRQVQGGLPQGGHRLRHGRHVHRGRGRRHRRGHGLPALRHRARTACGPQGLRRVRLRRRAGRHRRPAVRAPRLGLRTDRRRDPQALRREGAQDRGLRPLRGLPRSREGHEVLQQDLLHVQRQARHALQAQGPRRARRGLLHGHPRGRQGLRRVQPASDRGGSARSTSAAGSAASSATATR